MKTVAGILGLMIVAVGVAIAVYTQVNAPVREGIDKSIETGLAAPEIVETQRGNQEAPFEVFGQPRARVEALPGGGDDDDGDDRISLWGTLTESEKLNEMVDQLKRFVEQIQSETAQTVGNIQELFWIKMWEEDGIIQQAYEQGVKTLLDYAGSSISSHISQSEQERLMQVKGTIMDLVTNGLPTTLPDIPGFPPGLTSTSGNLYGGPAGPTIMTFVWANTTLDLKTNLNLDEQALWQQDKTLFQSFSIGCVLTNENSLGQLNVSWGFEVDGTGNVDFGMDLIFKRW